MPTLLIKDLAVTEDLDRNAMHAVRGGTGKDMHQGYQGYDKGYDYWMPAPSLTKNDFSFNASQLLGQSQDTVVNNGNNVAFAHGITANVNPTQKGTNTINFG